MAERFFPFQSVNGDRRYSAEDWTSYFSSFVGNGVFPSPSTGLQVVSDSNMQIKVRAGKAWINGYFYENTAEVRKQIDYADGALSRIDRVVLRWDLGTRDIGIKIKKGTPSSNPIAAAPTRNTGVWELVLADILVNRGVLRITNADITDKRHDSTVCGIVASAVQQLDATGLFAQYDALFNNFLQTLQNNLSGDVAGNLLNKLNDKQNKMVMSDSDFITVLTSNKTETDNAYLFMSRGDNGGSISGLGMTLYQALKNCETYTGYTIKYKSKPNATETSINSSQFQNAAFYIVNVSKTNKKHITITPIGGNAEEIEEIREQVQQCFWSASEMKTKIANALTGKGIPTSTTASTEQIVENINNGFADKIFNIFKAPMYAFRSYGGGDYEKTRASWYASGNQEEYILKDGLKTKTAVRINWGSCDFIAFELGRMDISKYKYIAIPAFGSQNTGKLNFLSCSSIFKKNRVTKQEFEDANAVRIHYDSGSLNTFYYVKRHSKDAIHVFDTYYHQFIAVPTMQYPVGDWFLVISRPISENEVKGTIVFYSKEGIG